MIAIKDMEMPRNCLDCPIRNYRDDDGNRCDLTGLYNREDCCPLVEIVTCKDCKYFEYDSMAKVNEVPLIVAHEICNRWGGGCKTKEDGYCFLFEPQESEDKE